MHLKITKEWFESKVQLEEDCDCTIGAKAMSDRYRDELANLLMSRALLNESDLSHVTADNAHEIVAGKIQDILTGNHEIHRIVDAIARKNGVGLLDRTAYSEDLLNKALKHYASTILNK